MDIVFAALGGPGVEGGSLYEALACRSDFEEVAFSDVPFAVRLRAPRSGEGGAWCPVELEGEDRVAILIEIASAIAAHLHEPVRAMASGIESTSGGASTKIGYRAYEIFPDGTKRTLSFPAADQAADADIGAELNERLSTIFAILIEDGTIAADWPALSGPPHRDAEPASSASPAVRATQHEDRIGRSFRRRVVIDDPRLARLAATIIAAKEVWFAPDPSGRVRLKIDASDGGKQISFVSADEAVTLQRATNRSWLALEPV